MSFAQRIIIGILQKKIYSVFTEYSEKLDHIFSEFVVSISQLKNDEINFRQKIVIYPKFSCIVCKNTPRLPFMLKTDCKCPVFICMLCIDLVNDKLTKCPKCSKPSIEYHSKAVFEQQILLCKYNDWSVSVKEIGFLDSTCPKCHIDFKYQHDLVKHLSHEICTGTPRANFMHDKDEAFDVKCSICFDDAILPTKCNTDCMCNTSISCLQCTRSIILHGEKRCVGCRSPIIRKLPMSMMYSKQRGFYILDDWFRKYGKQYYCRSVCIHCDKEFKSQIELHAHLMSLCNDSVIVCRLCRKDMKRRDMDTHGCLELFIDIYGPIPY